MITEYLTDTERIAANAKMLEALDNARRTEQHLLRSGKITTHRLDPKTVVITNPKSLTRFKPQQQ